MRKLPWLIYSADTDRLRRNEQRRTLAAVDDLRRLAETVRTHGLHLLLHETVDISFDVDLQRLPTDAVDGRNDDALGTALADATAVLITGGGIYIGSPATSDSRWPEFLGQDRTRGELGASALSGAYLGLSIKGRHG